MKTVIGLACGLLAAALAVLLWQTFYQKRMIRHLQKCLAWNDRCNLAYPTESAYFKHVNQQRAEAAKKRDAA